MDTISREGNSSMLPVGGIIVGVVALLLGGYAAITLSKVNKDLKAHEEKLARIDSVETQVSTLATDTARANKAIADNDKVYRGGFDQVIGAIGKLTEDVTAMKEAAKKPAAPAGKAGAASTPAVAGPNEYIVKAGDGGTKIATANGVSLKDLQDVNPGVDWTKLKIGQKLKLPAKR
jgi:LysM repeat protein